MRVIDDLHVLEFVVFIGRQASFALIASAVRLIRPLIAACATALVTSAAQGEVYFSDSSVEISGVGPRSARGCTVLLKPNMTYGGSSAPRLVLTTGTSRLSVRVDGASQYSSMVIVQDNARKAFGGLDNVSAEQFRLSEIGKAMKLGRLFFLTARRSGSLKFVSSRYERIDLDAVLARVEASCPFDAENFMTDLSARERAERALSVSLSDLTLIRWALNKKYGGSLDKPEPRLSLSAADRLLLKRYATENGLPASQFLTAETMRRLVGEGNSVSEAKRLEEERIAREAAALVKAREEEEEAARRKTLVWTISKNFNSKIGVEFYSQDRKAAWPGGNRQYTIDDQEPHTYRLDCNPGEKICYGAWLHTRPDAGYWGTGVFNRNACNGCCGRCGGGPLENRLTR